MGSLVVNVSASAKSLPASLGGASVAAKASVSLGNEPKDVAAMFATAGVATAGVWVVIAAPVATTGSQVGSASGSVLYAGGSQSSPRVVAASTDTPTAVDTEVLLLVQCTVTLDSALPDNTTLVFIDGTHNATAAAHTLTPNGGLSIYFGTGAQSSYPFNRSDGFQLVKKIAGAWYVGQ